MKREFAWQTFLKGLPGVKSVSRWALAGAFALVLGASADIRPAQANNNWVGPAIAGFRFPSEWRSGTGAVSGPDPTAFAPTTLRVGGLVDLDGDGADDRLVIGSVDGATGASVELAGGASLPVALPTIPHYAVVRRTDVRTEVVFSWLVSGGPGGIEAAGAEVADTCAEPWMRDAAALVLGRAPGAADYPTFGPLDRPDRTARLERARALVRSQTGRGHQVDESFAWFLDRPADPVGRAFWVNQLRSGRRRVEHLMVELLGSGEHYRATGATPEAWVDDAYQRLYGRTADPGGRAYWIRQVAAHGTGRTAARMFGEPEAHRFVVARVAGDDDAFGPGVDASVLRPGEAAFAVGGYDGFVADLVASADLYLLANERHRLVGS